VVGGGPAGVAVLRAREPGAEVALVERGMMGGICANDGCVPTRVFAHAVRLVRDVVLGTHIVGEQAVEVVQVAATAMRVEQLAALEFAYPTFTAVVGPAARRIACSLGLIPLARDDRERTGAAKWELRNG